MKEIKFPSTITHPRGQNNIPHFPEYLDRKCIYFSQQSYKYILKYANRIELDQTAPKEQSDLGLLFLLNCKDKCTSPNSSRTYHRKG